MAGLRGRTARSLHRRADCSTFAAPLLRRCVALVRAVSNPSHACSIATLAVCALPPVSLAYDVLSDGTYSKFPSDSFPSFVGRFRLGLQPSFCGKKAALIGTGPAPEHRVKDCHWPKGGTPMVTIGSPEEEKSMQWCDWCTRFLDCLVRCLPLKHPEGKVSPGPRQELNVMRKNRAEAEVIYSVPRRVSGGLIYGSSFLPK